MLGENILNSLFKVNSLSEFFCSYVIPAALSFYIGLISVGSDQSAQVSADPGQERDPSSVSASATAIAFANRSVSLSSEGKFLQAIAQIKDAIRLSPQDPDLYNNLASYHSKLNQYKSAEKNFSKALEIDPQHSAALFNSAVLYEKKKNWKMSIKNYQEFVKRHPAAEQAEAVKNRIRVLNSLIASQGQRRTW